MNVIAKQANNGATNGLKGKVKEIVRLMESQRNAKSGGRDITLRTFLADTYQLAPGHLYAELGFDPHSTQFGDLYADEDTSYLAAEVLRDGVRQGLGLAQRDLQQAMRSMLISGQAMSHQQAQAGLGQQASASLAPIISAPGTNWITPEVFYPEIMRGVVQAPYYQDLIISEVQVAQPNVVMPYINLSEAQLVNSDEGATIEEGTVSYGSKNVAIGKEAKGIKFTYESLQFNTLNLVQVFFRDFGRRLGARLNNKAITALINGDQADGSEASAVIGVENTGNKFTYTDLLRIAIRFQLLGRQLRFLVGNETTVRRFLELPEVKNKQFNGSPIVQIMLHTPLPTMIDVYTNINVPANQYIFGDNSAALVQLTALPLLVETEKIVSKQIQGTFASIYTGFANVFRDARVIADDSIAYAGHEFPTWMAAVSE